MKAITLYDVARVAGVSYQTVSRVINDAEHVSACTRKRSGRPWRRYTMCPTVARSSWPGNAPARWG
ncbi:LacI family DNA-binding transcriptional regulator [Enterobacter hormaechei]